MIFGYTPRRSGRMLTLSLVACVAGLTGCNKIVPNGTSDTMTLLRSGSEKVCVAKDVQDSLKGMILPKAEQLTGDASTSDKLEAIARLSFSYSLTTLQQFDKAVSKAICSTTVTITGVDNQLVKGPLTFDVSPAAENANSFVVSGSMNEAQSNANLLVTGALEKARTARAQQQEQVQQAQAAAQQAQLDARLLLVINDRWLQGVWVLDDAAASTCATSAAVRFQSSHALVGALGNGRWALSGTELHLIGVRQGQQIDERYTFSAADRISASAGMAETDAGFSLRRCTAAELQSTPDPGAAAVDVVTDQGPR